MFRDRKQRLPDVLLAIGEFFGELRASHCEPVDVVLGEGTQRLMDRKSLRVDIAAAETLDALFTELAL